MRRIGQKVALESQYISVHQLLQLNVIDPHCSTIFAIPHETMFPDLEFDISTRTPSREVNYNDVLPFGSGSLGNMLSWPLRSWCQSKNFRSLEMREQYQIVHAATAVMIPAKPKKAFFDCNARSRGVGIVNSTDRRS